ncbi:MAG: AAA family ATPase [Candidatus Aminicenantes bacterium]|nr:AAA family ATPase [Candidatus Aminicenantes bacterium]NIM78345.1 AAA family ATPase [Candidatus Aminicenantes bacterium]NIN17579.1 AAA family ATPase [Candidatus Aminicenantes bacterium]NIN41457.1 AAA family ATPase [Candidatus Aminicenantes bacterium]NIN84231.1 AAA family ATPase [Candidatus Aminicenantes bacterium]
MFAIIIAAFGLSWFAFLLYRFFKRKKHRRRKLHIGKEPGDTGFNEALSYTTNDAHRFYGRQNDTFNIMNQITREDYRLGVLHGESGVGKTSIIQAGLIPELKKKDILWAYISFNNLPGDTETSEALLEFLLRQLSRAYELPKCKNLEDITKRLAKKQAGFSVVFLDQFEQIFDRTDESARQDFAQYLEQFCLSNDRLKIVVIVRGDYFDRVYNMFQQLERKAISYLYRFNLPQAREVIRKSAGYEENLHETQPDDPLLAFEDDILDDLKDMDQRVHPVELSLICSTMMKVNGKLDRHAYLEEGKKQGWLNRYLDDVLKGQPQKESLQLLSSLIHMDKAATLTAKEVSQRAGLNLVETRRLLEDFQQSRLIVADVIEGEKEEKTYRLAHEYLIASIRIRVGDVETPVQKYSRLLETRANSWEQENRNPHHLLRGKSLLKIRFQLRKHLGWNMDPLKKVFVHKSFSRYLIVTVSSLVIISALLTGFFFTVHSLSERSRLKEYLSVLKYKYEDDLPDIEELLRLSRESIDFKIKVLKELLAVDNKDLYNDGIMPVLYHTLIGISMENRDKVMDYALSHIFPGNVGKLKWLFTRENMSPAKKLHVQKKLIDMLGKTKNSSYRVSIVEELGNIGSEKAVAPLIELLKDSVFPVRYTVREALEKICLKSEKALDTLIGLLKDPNINDNIKCSVAYALGKIGLKSEKAVDPLIELLKDPDNYVKSSAAEALGKIGNSAKDALPGLKQLYEKEKDIQLRFYSLRALLKIASSNKEYLAIMIEELLPHPLVVSEKALSWVEDIKTSILKTIGEVAVKDEEGKKVVGKNLDFDGNMWTMLEWWKTYKKKK